MEDIMDVLQIVREGSIINTSVKFRIYKETKLEIRNKNK
jgi:hypothetical protein